MSIAGGPLSKQPIAVDMWAHATTIAEDVTGDGVDDFAVSAPYADQQT